MRAPLGDKYSRLVMGVCVRVRVARVVRVSESTLPTLVNTLRTVVHLAIEIELSGPASQFLNHNVKSGHPASQFLKRNAISKTRRPLTDVSHICGFRSSHHSAPASFGLGIGLLVQDSVRCVRLLPCGDHAKRLHCAD